MRKITLIIGMILLSLTLQGQTTLKRGAVIGNGGNTFTIDSIIKSSTFFKLYNGATELLSIDTATMLTKYIQRSDTSGMLTKYARKASPTFTGTVTLPSGTSIGDVSSTEIGYVNGVTSAIQTQFTGKVNVSDTASMLNNYLNNSTVSVTEAGYLNGVTSAIQTQLTARQYFHYDYLIEEVSGTTYARPNPNSAYTAYSNAVPSTVLQSVIGALPVTGGTIVIREGTFDNCDTVHVNKDYITFIGMGQKNTILKLKDNFDNGLGFNTSYGFFHVTGEHVTFRDLQIDANALGQDSIDHGHTPSHYGSAKVCAILSEDAHYMMIDNCFVRGSTVTNIFTTGCDYVKVINSNIKDGFWNNITFGWGSDFCTVDNCLINGNVPSVADSSGCGDVGIALYGRFHTITNNIFRDLVGTRGHDNSRVAISLEYGSARSQGHLIYGNRIMGAGMKAGLSGNDIGGGAMHITFTGNYIDSCRVGIAFMGDSSTFTVNKIVRPQGDTYTNAGIHLQDASYNFVSGNDITSLTGGTTNYPILLSYSSVGASYNTITTNNLYGGSYYSIGIINANSTNNIITYNTFNDQSAGDYDIYDTGTGTIKKGNYDRHTARWTPDPTLAVGNPESFNFVELDSITKVSSKLVFYESGAQIDPLITDTINLASAVPLLNDTIPLFVFGLGGGLAADTAVFNDNALAGAFYNAGSDTLVVTQLMGILAEGSGTETVSVQVSWHATFKSGSATNLNAVPLAITSITTGTSDVSFPNYKIPPNVFVWCTISGVSLGNKPSFLSLTISGYKIPTY